MHGKIVWLFGASILLTALLGPAQPADAATIYNEWIPFTDDFDSCTGERVLVSGTQHLVGRMTEDGSGQLHFSFNRHTQGTGVGSDSGAEYLLIDSVAKADLIGSNEGETRVFTQMSQALFIRKGESAPNDDSLVHLFTHITITPDENFTATVEFTRATCA